MPVTHRFRCELPDDPQSQEEGEILISHWLEEHDVTVDLAGDEVTGNLAADRVDGLAAVATSGSYPDLVGAPPIPASTTVTGSDTMQDDDNYLLVNNTSGATVAITGPATPRPLAAYTIKDIAGNAGTYPITYTPASGLIDGRANFIMNTDLGSITFFSDGTNQWII